MSPEEAYAVANKSGKRIPKLERLILLSHAATVMYARDVLKSRWKDAEDFIGTDGKASYVYAKEVIKGRWTHGEKAVLSNPWMCCLYAEEVIKGRWKEAERIILACPYSEPCAIYAKTVIRGRWKQAEPVILRDIHAAWDYVINVVQGRWRKAEALFATDARIAAYYASLINQRFTTAEKIIATDELAAQKYADDVLAHPWDPKVAILCPQWLYLYARDVIKGKLPEEMHNRMITFGVMGKENKWVTKYLKSKSLQKPNKRTVGK
jgi:hypothetical protein